MSKNKKDILKFLFIALILLGLIVAWLGFGERGFIHLYRMEKERQTYVERINQLEEKNQQLFEEINRLRNDQDYIESVARRELGLIKDNEILYRFDSKQGNNYHAEIIKKKSQ
ncbi:MAG: septum formation initiator family protein [Thermodesulfobacteriota bacterium]|nr:septum formation initiator family protein [Thermodesulfobacteriota bacterium]